MNNPLVSICIPTFNGANYIDRCIASCLAQTYRNIEIVICDDCSNDNTIELLNQYAQKDSRIKIYKNETNKGLVANWNTTLSYACGEYIKWLFQDDWMTPDAIIQFVEIAKNGHDFIISKRNFVLDSTASLEEKKYFTDEVKRLENHFSNEEEGHVFLTNQIAGYASKYIALNFIGEPSLIFFKKDLLKKIGFYDPLLHQICDLEFNLRLASEVGVYVLNKPLCFFSIHSESTTKSNISKKYFQLRFVEQSYYAYKLLNDVSFVKIQNCFSLWQKLTLWVYYQYRIHEAKRFISKQADKKMYNEAFVKYPFLIQKRFSELLLTPFFVCLDILKSRR